MCLTKDIVHLSALYSVARISWCGPLSFHAAYICQRGVQTTVHNPFFWDQWCSCALGLDLLVSFINPFVRANAKADVETVDSSQLIKPPSHRTTLWTRYVRAMYSFRYV